MKIALAAPSLVVGGLEILMLRLAPFLMKSGHEVEFVLTEAPGPWADRARATGAVVTVVAPNPWETGRSHVRRLARVLIARGIDAVFINHDRRIQAALSFLPASIIAIPVIHNDVPRIYDVGLANSAAWQAAIGVSPHICAVARGRIARPVFAIPGGVEASTVPRPPVQPGTALRIAVVGRLFHPQKGVLLIPDILKRCRDNGMAFHCRIVGDGPDRETLQHRCQEFGSAVQILGAQAPELVYDILRESDVLLFPSFHEGLPLTPPEAMACGCVPVAARLEGSTTEVIHHGQNGILVSVGSTSGFASALLELDGDRAKLAALSAAAAADERFRVNTMGNAYLDAIAQAAKVTVERNGIVQADAKAWHDVLPQLVYARLKRLWALIRRARHH